MMDKVQIIALFLIVFAPAMVFAQFRTPEATLAEFIKFNRSQPDDFDGQGLQKRKRWLTPGLYALFLNELKREKEFLKQNPTDKPFFGDGFPFQPLDEVCNVGTRTYRRTHKIGRASSRNNQTVVPVYFIYPRQCELPAVTYNYFLIRTNAGWLISDVDTDGEILSRVLKRVNY